MSFIWPAMLVSLLLIPLFIGLYVRLLRQRRRTLALYRNFGVEPGAAGQNPGLRRHIPPILFLAGLTLLLVAVARPQATVSLPKIRGTVILGFDVSGSMAADDLKPTRMEAAKAAAQDFVERMPATVKIGVVAFSDNGFEVQEPTNDQELILAVIHRLAPERGTSLGQGILASLNTIAKAAGQGPHTYSNQDPSQAPTPTPVPPGTHTSAVIVMLTDGENNENPDPLAAAQTAADRGVRIFTVGIGSTAGTILHVDGFTVRSRLDEGMLQQIAQQTDGVYFNAENEQQLQQIYENLNPELVIEPEKMEITSILAGTSLLVLLLGGVFSLAWFSRLP